MNFEYSKSRQQKKEMVRKHIEKQHHFTKGQNSNQFLIDKKNNIVIPNLGINQLQVTQNMKKEEYSNYVNNTNLNLPLFQPTLFSNSMVLESIVDSYSEPKIKESTVVNKIEEEKNQIVVVKNLLPKNVIIVNNYQSSYANGKAKGFGDFLRGCYYLLQYCDKNKFQGKIDFSNHPLSYFLKNNVFMEKKNLIFKFDDINAEFIIGEKNDIQNKITDNYSLFQDFLNKQKIDDSTIFIFTNSFPISNPSKKHKDTMKFILEPTNEMVEYSKTILEKINLLNKPFTIIHIRFGDEYLIHHEKNFNSKILDKLKKEIEQFILSLTSNHHYLLLADNNSIKKYIIDHYPFIKTFFKDISHFGEGVHDEKEKIKNTMVDFYIMSYAKNIVSYSCYLHGSGFSKWCATTYNIPYTSKYIG